MFTSSDAFAVLCIV